MLGEMLEVLRGTPIDKTKLMELVPLLKELDEFEFYHPAHEYGILEHSVRAAELVSDPFLRLVLVFHDVGKPATAVKEPSRWDESVMITKFPEHEIVGVGLVWSTFRYEMDPKQLEILMKLTALHDTPLKGKLLDECVRMHGFEFVRMLLKIQYADMKAHTERYYLAGKPRLDKIRERLERLEREGL